MANSDSGECGDGGCPDCAYLTYGDYFEHKLNTDVMGMVIGREGSTLIVRLSPSLETARFQECELRLLTGDDEYSEPDDDETNVIRGVDFTRGGNLKDMEPKGAA